DRLLHCPTGVPLSLLQPFLTLRDFFAEQRELLPISECDCQRLPFSKGCKGLLNLSFGEEDPGLAEYATQLRRRGMRGRFSHEMPFSASSAGGARRAGGQMPPPAPYSLTEASVLP